MHLRLFDYFLWFATPLVQAGVLLAMWKRKLHSFYPRFFDYTILQVMSVGILACLFFSSYTLYYYSSYVNLGLSIIFCFAVVHEVTRDAFDHDGRLWKVLQVLWTVVVLAGILAFCLNLVSSHGDFGRVSDTLIATDKLVRVLQIALLFGFVFCGNWLRVSSRSFVYGVALGSGFFAIVNMLVAMESSHHGVMSSVALSRINGISYLVAALIWLAYASFGSLDPGGFSYLQLESPTEREVREWIERNSKDLRMSSIRARNLV